MVRATPPVYAGPPHLSLADRGITFATNRQRGLCIRLHRPHPAIDPLGLIRHPGVTVTVGDVDGRLGLDLFVVQGCTPHGNAGDLLLLDAPGWDYDPVFAPPVGRGCGDTAAMLDVDGDHRQDVVVTNGRWARRGPVQVLTAGPWRG